MARIHGLPKGTRLSGSFGDFSFYNHNGKTFLRKKRAKNNKSKPSTLNLQFGLASRLSKHLRLALDQNYRIGKSYTEHQAVTKILLNSIKDCGKFDPLRPLPLQDIKVRNNTFYFISPQYFQLDRNSGTLTIQIPNRWLASCFHLAPKPFDLLLKATTLSEERLVNGKYLPLHHSWHPHNFIRKMNISSFKPQAGSLNTEIKLIHEDSIIPPEVGIILTIGIGI